MMQGKNINIDINSSIRRKKEKTDNNTGYNVTNNGPPSLMGIS
jgi:hypothetical protein